MRRRMSRSTRTSGCSWKPSSRSVNLGPPTRDSTMRRFLSAAAGLALVVAPTPAMDTYPRQTGITPQHYVFALTLSDATDEIVGEATVTMRFNTDGLSGFFLDLTTANAGKGMTVTAVTADSANGTPLHFTHAQNHVTIT